MNIKQYKLNMWNPLTYIFLVISIPIAMVVCLFTDHNMQEFIIHNYDCIRGVVIIEPRKIFIYSWIVRRVKDE